MPTAPHSPLPWTAGKAVKDSNFADYCAFINGDSCKLAKVRGGIHDKKETAEANAAFIARACNSHDALIGALQTCHGYISVAAPHAEMLKEIETALAAAQGDV